MLSRKIAWNSSSFSSLCFSHRQKWTKSWCCLHILFIVGTNFSNQSWFLQEFNCNDYVSRGNCWEKEMALSSLQCFWTMLNHGSLYGPTVKKITAKRVKVPLVCVNFPIVITGTDQNIIKNPVMIGWRTNL